MNQLSRTRRTPSLGRGNVEVIEDLPMIGGVSLPVEVPEQIKSAMLIPCEVSVPFELGDGRVKVYVPAFQMHTGIMLGYIEVWAC